ncbi:MAG: DUF1998 domain-containing protein, partial [Armatimonadota bacterium]|nr:DUF1998 domain-containing protein [Armatimonadota bacterium]
PEKTWLSYRYQICDNCGMYRSVLSESSEELPAVCDVCGSRISPRSQQFVVPEFGFISDKRPSQAGAFRPRRLYGSRAHFAGARAEASASRELTSAEVHLSIYCREDAQMAVINRAPFYLCPRCGRGRPGGGQPPSKHKTPWGSDCNGKFLFANLGHQFLTDAAQLQLDGVPPSIPTVDATWLSLLYALLGATSETLQVPARDLNGCLYPGGRRVRKTPDLVLFDNVPGGAGHTLRLAEPGVLEDVLETAIKRMRSCTCETSCYSCLRSYQNQYCHDELDRQRALDVLVLMVSDPARTA